MKKIQDFILGEKETEETKTEFKAKKATKMPSYELIIETEKDFVIKKKTPRTEALLVVMPSQNQFYIKQNDETIEELKRENLDKFFSPRQTDVRIKLEKCSWLENITCSLNFVDRLLHIIEDEHARKLIDDGFFFTNWPHNDNFYAKYDTYEYTQKFGKNMMNELINYECELYNTTRREIMKKHYSDIFPDVKYGFLLSLVKHTGLSDFLLNEVDEKHALEILKKFCEYNLNVSETGDSLKRISQEFDNIDDMFDFLICEYKENKYHYGALSTLTQNLKTHYMFQNNTHGKVINKKPKNINEELAFYRAVHSFGSYSILKNISLARDEEPRKWIFGDYVILKPASEKSLAYEALYQSNFLMKYLYNVPDVNKETYVYFLRKLNESEKPLITIETDNSGNILNVEGQNSSKDFIPYDVINEWRELCWKNKGEE